MHASNRFITTMGLFGVVVASGVAAAAEPAMSASECFVPALEAGNAEAVAACYAEDGIIWFPGGPMAKGRAAIRDGFAGFLASANVKSAVLTEMGHVDMGDTRATWGTYVITMVNKTTQAETVETGRYTDVQKKIDGRWLYLVDHPSDDPATAGE